MKSLGETSIDHSRSKGDEKKSLKRLEADMTEIKRKEYGGNVTLESKSV